MKIEYIRLDSAILDLRNDSIRLLRENEEKEDSLKKISRNLELYYLSKEDSLEQNYQKLVRSNDSITKEEIKKQNFKLDSIKFSEVLKRISSSKYEYVSFDDLRSIAETILNSSLSYNERKSLVITQAKRKDLSIGQSFFYNYLAYCFTNNIVWKEKCSSIFFNRFESTIDPWLEYEADRDDVNLILKIILLFNDKILELANENFFIRIIDAKKVFSTIESKLKTNTDLYFVLSSIPQDIWLDYYYDEYLTFIKIARDQFYNNTFYSVNYRDYNNEFSYRNFQSLSPQLYFLLKQAPMGFAIYVSDAYNNKKFEMNSDGGYDVMDISSYYLEKKKGIKYCRYQSTLQEYDPEQWYKKNKHRFEIWLEDDLASFHNKENFLKALNN